VSVCPIVRLGGKGVRVSTPFINTLVYIYIIALCREGPAMGDFQIFNVPWPIGLKDLKSRRPPITGPSPILDHWFESTVKVSVGEGLVVSCDGILELGLWPGFPRRSALPTGPSLYLTNFCVFLQVVLKIFPRFASIYLMVPLLVLPISVMMWMNFNWVNTGFLTHIRFHLRSPFCKK
jgi:hypothetical protein